MKNYITLIIIGMFFLSACKNTEFVADTGNSDPVTIPQDPVDDTNITDANDSDSATTIDSNVTEELIRKEPLPEVNAKEWYVRLVVEDSSNDLKAGNTQLGEIALNDAVQEYALKALVPFGSSYVDIVFVDPIGVDVGAYKSSFHVASTNADSWEFTVKSSDANATMILSWRGLYILESYVDSEGRTRYHEHRSMTNPLLKYMTLFDVSNNIEIPVLYGSGMVNEYVFDMNGTNERVFQWKIKDSTVRLPSNREIFSRVVAPVQKQDMNKIHIEALRKDAKATPEKLREKRLNTLDMRRPPSFEVWK